MVTDVNDYVDPQAAVGGDAVVHGAIQELYERLQVRPFTAGAQANPRLVARRVICM